MRHQPSRDNNWQGWLFRVAQREAWRIERELLDHAKHELNPLHELEVYAQIGELSGDSKARVHKLWIQADDRIREILTERERQRGHPSHGGNLLNYAQLTLDHVRVTAGQAGAGGGVANLDGAILRVAHSLVDHNLARSGDALETGGGIYSRGALAVADSTIAFNEARAGGGIALDGATAALERVTVAWNSALTDAPGGLLIAGGGSASVAGSLLAGNAAANCGRPVPADRGGNLAFPDDCGFGAVADPQLATGLVAGVGETPVLTIPAGSSAVDRAGACTGRDQRDLPRPQVAACDVGAYEVAAPAIDGGPSGASRGRLAKLRVLLARARSELRVRPRRSGGRGRLGAVHIAEDVRRARPR